MPEQQARTVDLVFDERAERRLDWVIARLERFDRYRPFVEALVVDDRLLRIGGASLRSASRR